MAYQLHHTIEFNSPITERVRVELYKDATPDAVTELRGLDFRMSYNKGNGDKFDTIIACEATISFQIDRGSSLTYADFLVSFKTEWKVIALVDDVTVFIGWLTPGEGHSEFQDLPYDITLSAIDGLGLLKGKALTDINSDNFDGENYIINYILGALQKTQLNLDLHLFCNIYEASMTDRFTDPEKDAFNQGKLDYRTFQKDASSYVDCYAALEAMLGEHFSLYQWNGKWVILRVSEMQDSPGPQIWHTEYDYQGNVIDASQYGFGPCEIGKDCVIHPINRSQFISSRFAIKSAKHTYDYIVWPELPKNNRFDRGNLLALIFGNVYAKDDDGNDTADQIGTYQGYTIDDWDTGDLNSGPTAVANLPALAALTGTVAQWRSSNNTAGEFEREIVITNVGDGSGKSTWFQCEGFPVKQGDRVKVDVDYKLSFNFVYPGGSPLQIDLMVVYIVDGNGDKWWWTNRFSFNGTLNYWIKQPGLRAFRARWEDGEKTKPYASFSVESKTIPTDGTMYIALTCPDMSTLATGPFTVTYKKFNVTYSPYIAGGYLPVKGDYWLTSQNLDVDDTVDEAVGLSDSLRKVFKGAILKENGDLTSTWHRLNKTEERGYKELLNLGRYNHAYRRMWRIDGDFGGTRFNAVDNPVINEPLGFHKHFYFKNAQELSGVMFMMVPPLTVNYTQGEINATFVECLNTNDTAEGATAAGQIVSLMVAAINALGVPLTTAYLTSDPTIFRLHTPDGVPVVLSVDDNGVGNSPSLTELSETDISGPLTVREIQVGTDVMATNEFTITINGVPITITATSIADYQDGTQEGDTHEFNYIKQ